MGRFAFSVGNKSFSTKKNALAHYRKLLDSYEIGEELDLEDAKDLLALAFRKHGSPQEVAELAEEIAYGFTDQDLDGELVTGFTGISVGLHPKFKSTRCFYFWGLIEGEITKDLFSYVQAINGQPSNMRVFSRACRFAVQANLRQFKIQQFKHRPVRCVLTNEVVEWEECQVDHKSPLTFSVIVKSFIVAKQIEIDRVEYSIDKDSLATFADQQLAAQFVDFHKQMAVLRILSKKENVKRSGEGRIKPTRKDSIIVD